jgi:phospholipase/lecithinase/hemolysin
MRHWRLVLSVRLYSIGLSVLSAALPASAGQFTKLVVFGDSLSDMGAVFALTQGPECRQLRGMAAFRTGRPC